MPATVSFQYPWAFWVTAVLFAGLMTEVLVYNRRVWTIPSLVVYGTVGTWYLGNVIQDGPVEFLDRFGTQLTTTALLQVVLFLMTYRGLIQRLFRRVHDPRPRISMISLFDPAAIANMVIILVAAWALIFVAGIVNTEGKLLAVLWPPSSATKIAMFPTNGVGAGIDFLFSAANYVYILICTLFGIFFVLSRGSAKVLALTMMAVTWPYFFFDRTRNVMLAVLLPAVFCYWLATWGRWGQKAAISLVLLVALNFWFLQVMHYRGEGDYEMPSILAFSATEEETGHAGLEMLNELCYMDYFTERGDYKVTLGTDYLAEVAQVIPRTIWPSKPMLGIDYAVVRGYGMENVSEESLNAAGVAATISTGVIGQGVGNFGPFFGVIAAAFLMALWTRILASLWLRRTEIMRFLLFVVGCGLTFNMGRDITLLVLWPFAFGYIFVLLIERVFPAFTGKTRSPRSLISGQPLKPMRADPLIITSAVPGSKSL